MKLVIGNRADAPVARRMDFLQYSDSRDLTKNRYFANDAQGQALTVVNGRFDGRSGRLTESRAFDNALARTGNQVKAQYFFFANGQNIGTFGQLVDSEGAIKANFDVNYTPVSQGYPASVPSDVIAQTGDTLRSIAARVFGDASLWYVLAEANGLTDPYAALEAGTQIRVPNKVLSVANDAASFKPFDTSPVFRERCARPGTHCRQRPVRWHERAAAREPRLRQRIDPTPAQRRALGKYALGIPAT